MLIIIILQTNKWLNNSIILLVLFCSYVIITHSVLQYCLSFLSISISISSLKLHPRFRTDIQSHPTWTWTWNNNKYRHNYKYYYIYRFLWHGGGISAHISSGNRPRVICRRRKKKRYKTPEIGTKYGTGTGSNKKPSIFHCMGYFFPYKLCTYPRYSHIYLT